jgi:hypothetical protein
MKGAAILILRQEIYTYDIYRETAYIHTYIHSIIIVYIHAFTYSSIYTCMHAH